MKRWWKGNSDHVSHARLESILSSFRGTRVGRPGTQDATSAAAAAAAAAAATSQDVEKLLRQGLGVRGREFSDITDKMLLVSTRFVRWYSLCS